MMPASHDFVDTLAAHALEQMALGPLQPARASVTVTPNALPDRTSASGRQSILSQQHLVLQRRYLVAELGSDSLLMHLGGREFLLQSIDESVRHFELLRKTRDYLFRGNQ